MHPNSIQFYLTRPYTIDVADPDIAKEPAYTKATTAITLTSGVAAIAMHPTEVAARHIPPNIASPLIPPLTFSIS
jgi:hypothetical protein